LGLAQLERCDEIMSKRRENAKRLTELLSIFKDFLQLPIYNNKYSQTYMMYPIMIISKKFTRKDITGLLENNNIETRPLFPLLNQPFYKRMYGDLENMYPNAKNVGRNGFYIGCHHGLDDDDLVYIYDSFKSFF